MVIPATVGLACTGRAVTAKTAAVYSDARNNNDELGLRVFN